MGLKGSKLLLDSINLVSNGKQFAAYMPVYPGCDLVFKDMKLVNKPMLMLHAEFDDYAPIVDCINYVSKLKQKSKAKNKKPPNGGFSLCFHFLKYN